MRSSLAQTSGRLLWWWEGWSVRWSAWTGLGGTFRLAHDTRAREVTKSSCRQALGAEKPRWFPVRSTGRTVVTCDQNSVVSGDGHVPVSVHMCIRPLETWASWWKVRRLMVATVKRYGSTTVGPISRDSRDARSAPGPDASRTTLRHRHVSRSKWIRRSHCSWRGGPVHQYVSAMLVVGWHQSEVSETSAIVTTVLSGCLFGSVSPTWGPSVGTSTPPPTSIPEV